VYTDDGKTLEFDISNRYKVLKEVIDESSNKVLVFIPFKHVIDVLEERLKKDNVSNGIIRGDVAVNKRTDLFNKLQTTPDPQVLLIQPQAAAHGVTLTAADTVVWWGPTSSLETYLQANARVHRAGQVNKCTVVHIRGSNVEKHIYTMLSKRIDSHSRILDLYKEILD
jgi:SNF2 family DNA or RNA helicase